MTPRIWLDPTDVQTLALLHRNLRTCAAAGLLMLVTGCMNGYPSEDQPRDSALSSREHMRALNVYLEAGDHEYEPHFKLPTPCLLELSGLSNEPGDRRRVIELKSMRISLRSDQESGVFSVTISKFNAGSELLVHSFPVGDWIDAVAFRSHLQQLTMSCVNEFEK